MNRVVEEDFFTPNTEQSRARPPDYRVLHEDNIHGGGGVGEREFIINEEVSSKKASRAHDPL
jgi:hypothetical protein